MTQCRRRIGSVRSQIGIGAVQDQKPFCRVPLLRVPREVVVRVPVVGGALNPLAA